MNPFRSASIKQKLMWIIMLISSVSVLLTTLAITFIGIFTLRQNMKDEMWMNASIVGDRNAAIITFGQPSEAEESLNKAFSITPAITRACLYDVHGNLFSGYFGDVMLDRTCPQLQPTQVGMDDQRLWVFKDIEKRGKIGSIFIESDLRAIESYIRKQIIIALGVTLTVLIVSSLLAFRLQRSISIPLLRLADTARRVSVNKDYSIRASRDNIAGGDSRNELITLIDSFNTMLGEIEERDLQLRRKTEELEAAKDAAEAANRAKSQFLANISHELRTPLNAIIGFSSILVNQLFGALGNPKYIEYARDINDSGVHLLDIINDILDLSKAEAGKLKLVMEEVHIEKTIRKCITLLAERANEGGISITTEIPRDLPYLYADRLRFIQIILNLLSNAVKFTEEGGKVHITVETDPPDTKEISEFIVTIRDSGIGMAEEDIGKAFQSFGQIDSGLNRRYEGTGLGLPLTKKLVELHQGRIGVQSALGKGTTVTVRFPAKKPQPIEL